MYGSGAVLMDGIMLILLPTLIITKRKFCSLFSNSFFSYSPYSAKHDEYWREAQQDELQKALRNYLGVRGIKVEWDYWSWLCEYAESLEDYDLSWWQNLKAFIEK
jgi:hypothetical protein